MSPRRNEENTIRVCNLPEYTDESDLLHLFSSFGDISRVYVAVDQETGIGRGFVNFVKWEDAERAIENLNACGYDGILEH
ncbi:hypothetical protein MKW92_036015 [Papaver armeniacum]|nr:hypothetical protein MKW92_036015 [Papaver armeniacum]